MVALLALALFLLPASARQSKPIASALAPIELLVEGLGNLGGIAVGGTGAVFVSEWDAGKIFKIVPGDRPEIVVDHLRHPGGVALDRESRLVVAEGGKRRILRVEESGDVTTLASGLKHPRWIGAAPDGSAYVTVQDLVLGGEESNDDESESEVIGRVTPEGKVQVFADRFRGLQGLTVEQDALSVVAKGRKWDRHAVGTLYWIPIESDGRAGPATPLAMNQFVEPTGLAGDRLGARFVSAKSLTGEPWRQRVIVRVAPDGTPTLFAEDLEDPQGLGFGPDGSLYLADGRSGRILRFVAPHPPALEENPPAVTSQRRVVLRLRIEAGAQLTVLGGQLPVIAMADRGGSAWVSVALHVNAENHLLIFTTAAAGRGLTSAPLEVSVIHDDQPPAINLVAPKDGTVVRGTVAAEASAVDAHGIAGVEFRLDGSLVGFDTVAPFRVTIDTEAIGDGPRTVSAVARDRAGNAASVSAQVTVDNTPPEVRVVRPVSGIVSGGPVEVVVEANDAASGVARVELAVDGILRFVAETPPYRFQIDSQALGVGPHVLVAAATDRAGNRGESAPVSVVVSGISVGISEPAEGAQVPAGLVLVRGRVEGGGAEVGVTVNSVPAAIDGAAYAALVPVSLDTKTLTAVATAATGATASHEVAVRVIGRPSGALLATPQSGVAPMTAVFSLVGTVAPASIELDFDGDGIVDFTGSSLDGRVFTYAQPGLYFPKATITDASGRRFTLSSVVHVYGLATLDVLLLAKWTAMKEALRRGDINAAVESIVLAARDDYRDLFTGLTVPLGQIDLVLGSIGAVSFDEGQVEYQMIRVDNGARLSYLVLFAKDADGIWRLRFF